MDLNQLKKIIEKEKGKVIIVENGEPTLVVSRFEDEQQQLSFNPSSFEGERVDKKKKLADDKATEQQKIIQSTEMIAKEELPSDELTIEDLPF